MLRGALRGRYRYFKQIWDGEAISDKIRLFFVFTVFLVPKRIRDRLGFYNSMMNFLSGGLVMKRLGKRFSLATHDNLSHLRDEFEEEIWPWFNMEKGGVFVDVGANIGRYSVLLSERAGRVMAFEPCRNTFSALARNVKLNDLANVTPYRMALGDVTGKGMLNVTYTSGQSSLKDMTFKVVERQEVAVCRFDELGDVPGRIDLVKIDTEGAELEVLRGMEGSIRRHRPRLIIEVKDPNVEGVNRFLSDNGYVVAERSGENVLAIPKI